MRFTDLVDYICHYTNYNDLEEKYLELLKENIKLKEESEKKFDIFLLLSFIVGFFSGLLLIIPFIGG